MSKKNKPENKFQRRNAREAHDASLCIASPNAVSDQITRKVAAMPVARVQRLIGRSVRRVRRVNGILKNLSPTSKFRPALEIDRAIAAFTEQAATRELAKRTPTTVKTIDPAVLRRQALRATVGCV